MKKILITGAFGFLGTAAAIKFSNSGWQVFGIGRGRPSISDKKNIFTSWFSADITLDNLLSFGIYPDVIVSCAGGSSVTKVQQNVYANYDSTIGSTQSVLEFQKKCPRNTHLVFISSAAVYGNAYRTPIPETAINEPISVYGQHKMLAENLCMNYVKNYHLNISVIRFFSLFGPGLKKQLLWDAAIKAQIGQNTFFGTGQEMRDFLYITDAVELIYLLCNLQSKGLQIYNGGSGTPISIKDMLECLYRELQTNLTPNFSQKQNPGDPHSLVSNNFKSTSLGWSPKVSMLEGIKNYAQWFYLSKNSS